MLCFPCLAIKTTLSVKIQNCSIFVAKSHIYKIFVAICSETLKTNRTEIFSPDLSSTKVPQPAHWWWWQPHCWWWRPPCRPPYLPPCRSPGPSGIKNFNPGIFRDEILPNPGIPGFFGTGFPNIFDPGILLKSFGIFRDFHFCFICLSNRIIFINIYHHRWHNHHHYHCHSSSPFIGIIISDCVERASLLNVEFYVLSQCAVKKHAFITPITIKMCV